MHLHIKRAQANKMFGGVKFELTARVTLTSEESELISRYKVQNDTLMNKTIQIPLTDRALVFKITIGSLIDGQTFKCNDVQDILANEHEVKEACMTLRSIIEKMKTFGGEEVIEITGDGAQVLSTKA